MLHSSLLTFFITVSQSHSNCHLHLHVILVVSPATGCHHIVCEVPVWDLEAGTVETVTTLTAHLILCVILITLGRQVGPK